VRSWSRVCFFPLVSITNSSLLSRCLLLSSPPIPSHPLPSPLIPSNPHDPLLFLSVRSAWGYHANGRRG
jgi:hypothetical protein